VIHNKSNANSGIEKVRQTLILSTMINDTMNPAHHPSEELLSKKRDTFKTTTFKSRKNVCVGCIKYNEKSFSK